ncbi:MAG: sigma-54-dependent Fis family transcriptional regulator [Gammaproteobacteria bacterium]|nr:sigma-54-dependent Fis family transcriptional regulator [Gammaproteobacteria bacterium]
MSQARALIIDDEPDILELLAITLGRMRIQAVEADCIAAAKTRLAEEKFDLCLTDMRLPDGDGLDLVRHVQQQYADTPIAVITAHGNMETAIQAMKLGAFDFVSKPVDLNKLRELVANALKLREQAKASAPLTRLLGSTPQIENLRATIMKLARSQAPVYISGESGTGKELVARLIHEQGPRADAPFVPVNCGAIPTELMESEFFGHKKGSFTGAVTDKPGLFQAANEGTLFLDEVADLPLPMQVKLLRAIQEKAVRPVGEEKEIPVNVRIVSATHKDLAALVHHGQFRQDLFYRINVIEVKVPPLRARAEDIPVLAEHILARLSTDIGVDAPLLCSSALRALQAYTFPGNVRELENILERSLTLCEGDVIEAEDLRLPEAHPTASPDGPAGIPALEDRAALGDYLGDIEKEAILKALEETRWNRTAAAKKLGITFRAMRYRLKKLGLE